MRKITQTSWYQESVRLSGLSGRTFALNAIFSLAMLAALATFALASN